MTEFFVFNNENVTKDRVRGTKRRSNRLVPEILQHLCKNWWYQKLKKRGCVGDGGGGGEQDRQTASTDVDVDVPALR